MIVWWIAIHDVPEEQTFEIYPDWFLRPVSNDTHHSIPGTMFPSLSKHDVPRPTLDSSCGQYARQSRAT